MSWIAVGGAAAGAIIGGVQQNQQNKKMQGAQNAANKQAGWVDVTTTRRGDPMAEGFRYDGMAAAYNALFGGNEVGLDGRPLRIQGDPRAGGGGGAGGPIATSMPATVPRGNAPAVPPGGSLRPDGRILDARGKTIYSPPAGGSAKAPKPGKGSTTTPAGTTGPAARTFDGMSQETDDIRRSMIGLQDVNRPMNTAAESFLTDTLAGEERNSYRGEAAGAARAIAADPELAAYQAALRGSLGVGGKGGGGGGAGGGGASRGRGGGSSAPAYQQTLNQQPGGYGATGTGAALAKLVKGEAPAGFQEMQDAISRQVAENRASTIRDLRARAVGSGFYGGDLYQDLEEGAIAQGDQELADSLAAARFGAYQNALGLGTQYDLGMADMGSRERIASASASAAGAADAADRESRERLAMYGMWGDSIDLGQRGRAGSAGALGDLAGLTSEDQRFAVGGVNDLAGSRRADLGAAGELSLGADSNRNAWTAAKRQEGTARAGIRAGASSDAARLAEQQRQFDAGMGWDREQFYDPFSRLAAYGGALNTFYGGLGSETTSGRDMRGASPPAFAGGSVAGAGLSGAALGGQIAGAYQRPRAAPQGSTIYD